MGLFGLKKFFSFFIKFLTYNLIWFSSAIVCVILLSSFHPNEETMLLNGFETVFLFGFPTIVCITAGRKLFQKGSSKCNSKSKILLRKIFAKPDSNRPLDSVTELVTISATDQSIRTVIEPTIKGTAVHKSIEQAHSIPISMESEHPLESVDFMDGHEFEHWCADLLRKIGFLNVSVTKGSGDQGVDVLAEKDGIRFAVQCKCYSRDLGNTPVQEVNAGKVFYRCQIGAVMTNRHFTTGAKELAEATGVLLWDRDWIISHLSETKGVKLSTNPPKNDEMIWDAWNVIKETNIASVSILQRRLKIGYARAARIIDELEELGYLGPFQGSKPREILK